MEVTNRLIAAMHGLQLAAMGRFITQYDPLARRYAAAEVASALKWTTRAAASRLEWGEHLTTTLPRTLAALCAGVIDIAKARTMIEQTEIIDPDIAGQVEDAVISQAENRNYRWFRDAVKRTIGTLDPEGCEQRRQEKKKQRRVEKEDADDGMAWLSALLPAEKTEAIYQLIDKIAHNQKTRDDQRSMDEIRADVLADRILGDPSNVRIRIDVKVNATTMMGLDNAPGQIVGHGPITAEHARELGMQPGSEWFRLWTDGPTDTVLDYGRLKYKPNTTLADYVRANTPTCIFPSCNRPAMSCELDHTVPFPDGPTSADNLKPLCKYHHECKTHHGWDVAQVMPDVYIWTSPLGRTYVVAPETKKAS